MNILLSHENHFKFGYNGKAFTYRQSPEDQWFVEYGKCQRRPRDFKSECLETARQIRRNTSLDLYVMFSGGVDSEVVLRSFVEAKIPVTAAIMRFKNELNAHDIAWAVKACDKLNVPYEFYDLDLLSFWSGEYLKYSEPTYCVSPQLLPTMWLADQIPGYAIMGSGECFLARVDAPDPKDPPPPTYVFADWVMYEREKIAAWYRHFMVQGREACPGFFQYTPEVMLSYLQDPFLKRLCNNEIYGKYSTASSKLKIYQQHFPELEDRPKYTGYEHVQEEDAKLRKKLLDTYPSANQIYYSEYHQLIKDLTGYNETIAELF